ncbi:hypothetical protein ABZU32_36930 [Sphaerisporangium sp. NPDC005288]|uniref:hypothetical protein n=1 Tax=Sphaerisporangium sp. NPDC005288 TaxID=3155114 RepID=UPI0033A74E14
MNSPDGPNDSTDDIPNGDPGGGANDGTSGGPSGGANDGTSDGTSGGAGGGLEAELLALGEALDIPAPPPADVARSVRTRLEGLTTEEPAAPPGRSPETRRPARRPRWRWVAAGVAVVVAALLGLTPQGQAAVAHVLRLAGVEIHVGEPGPLPSGVPSPLPGERRVTLDRARELVAFPVRVPAELGEPDDVRVSDDGRVLSLFWPGTRLDAYDGTLEVVWRKDLPGPFPEQVTVGASPGWWVSGPHGLTYMPRAGAGSEPVQRRAASTLIWQQGQTGYRLEGPATSAQALRIAASLH